jgi:hypothetical protein
MAAIVMCIVLIVLGVCFYILDNSKIGKKFFD